MRTQTYSLRLLSPCFNRGADQNNLAELRVPSIRGKIRWWYREAFIGKEAERYQKILFGDVKGRYPEDEVLHPDLDKKIKNVPQRSSVTFRLADTVSSRQKFPMLPHDVSKTPPQPALPPQEFDLLFRCQDNTFAEVDRAVRLWILLGTLGARGNRAAGSVWFREGAPDSAQDLQLEIQGLRCPRDWDIRVAPVESFDQGRLIASDTVTGVDHLLGGISPRKDSPIKFKLIELGTQPHILLFAPQPNLWEQAVKALAYPKGGGPAKPLSKLEWIPVS